MAVVDILYLGENNGCYVRLQINVVKGKEKEVIIAIACLCQNVEYFASIQIQGSRSVFFFEKWFDNIEFTLVRGCQS